MKRAKNTPFYENKIKTVSIVKGDCNMLVQNLAGLLAIVLFRVALYIENKEHEAEVKKFMEFE